MKKHKSPKPGTCQPPVREMSTTENRKRRLLSTSWQAVKEMGESQSSSSGEELSTLWTLKNMTVRTHKSIQLVGMARKDCRVHQEKSKDETKKKTSIRINCIAQNGATQRHSINRLPQKWGNEGNVRDV